MQRIGLVIGGLSAVLSTPLARSGETANPESNSYHIEVTAEPLATTGSSAIRLSPALRESPFHGTVVLSGIIDTDGHLREMRSVEGQPLLARAALQSVESWRYRPIIFGNRAIPAELKLVLHFTHRGWPGGRTAARVTSVATIALPRAGSTAVTL